MRIHQPLLVVTFPASLQTSGFGGFVSEPLEGVSFPSISADICF
jgi:hypothetical protein